MVQRRVISSHVLIPSFSNQTLQLLLNPSPFGIEAVKNSRLRLPVWMKLNSFGSMFQLKFD